MLFRSELGRDKARAAALGGEGAQVARAISWETVVDRLTAAGMGH